MPGKFDGGALPPSPKDRAVLVTGASSGLGRACALHLARVGFPVFAGVRKEADGKELADAAPASRLTPVLVDVTNEESVTGAAARVADATGDRGLWGLVNNAGVCVSAPLECVTPERLRWQLETNVVGQLTVTRAFLPALRRAGGRIVNVTSGLGSVALPYLGAYASAQFAKEALSDVLRRELHPSGVHVSVVQPGAIMTPIWGKVGDVGRAALENVPERVADVYRVPFNRFLHQNEEQARRSRTRPEDFARTVTKALMTARPRTRYRVGADARNASVLARVLPDVVLDRYLRAIAS
ncbi:MULTISPECIES: SDR family oxidoreductase [Streptomyces]|uniref:SDR family oxidoreductase n=3 Tax=Streptomyces rimosus TaxID=1927 RepID=L8ER59_STRR1|nr:MULTISPECIES: SDR family oxidoreductase [Streptomyces]KOG82240.1 short-chain dehydrogenase [Kitasatospora aureofaciens]MYT47521.1 SDR family NAD(P)-dependent oxidoreductase [Streptomyces sp. SID5471]KOT25874.1 short-chain dehydrogenase [Streptomyces sp. NRRL WC-3701]KOT64588.1 short-chain dehydrogenase [Streptomyces rimosus subsp. rimosus]KOT71773.1 short-chain dehydrogenase [Streptomyces rimosus subsp. rimosus]